MNKIILSVQKNLNLTAQTPQHMSRPDRALLGISLDSFNVSYVLNLGSPQVVTLIHLYLSESSTRVLQVIRDLNSLGYCFLISLNDNTPNSSLSFLYGLGITNSVETWNASFPVSFYTLANNFFNISKYTEAGITVTHKLEVSGRNFGYSIPDNILAVPITKIAAVSSTDSRTFLGILEKGSVLKDSFITKAPIILSGFLYAAESHIVEIINPILDDIYYYADSNSNPPYYVKGIVTSTLKEPLIRKITVHDQGTGSFLNETFSDENGNYVVKLSKNNPVFIVCHPIDSTKKGQIHTNVIPLINE